MTSPTERPSLWRDPDYLLLWGGQTVSAAGSQVSGFVLPLLVLTLTGSALQAGLVGALQGVPYIVLSLPAGVLTDRWNRKRVMIVCDTLRTLNMASIALALAVGRLTLVQLFLVALIEGTLFVFFDIAETAALSRVVGQEQLPSSRARQETTWGLSALIGPPLAGFLYQSIGVALPFLADAVSYAVSALSLTAIRSRFQGEPSPRTASAIAELREAAGWLWGQPLLRLVALITAAGDFLFSGISLIPLVIARQQMHAPPVAIGFIFTLAAVGAILGSAVAGRIRRRLRFSTRLLSLQWLLAGLYPLLAIAPTPLALGLVRAGMSATVSDDNTIRLSYQISSIPDPLQGRVNSLTALAAYGSLPIGQALTGISLQTLGPTMTILLVTACLIALAVVISVSPTIRNPRV